MTPEEQLAYERQIADVLAIRHKAPAEKGALVTWLNSSVLVALISVLGTGLLGAWITASVQRRSKENEMQQAAAAKRTSDQNAAALQILAIVASQSSAIDDLLTTAHSGYLEDRYSNTQERKKLADWKVKVRESYNEAESTWRRNKITAGYSLLYVFDANPTVEAVWSRLAVAADALDSCASARYSQVAEHGTDEQPSQICVPERSTLATSLEQFTNTVAIATREKK